jgi:CBS domain containing-hemolysin-like protein
VGDALAAEDLQQDVAAEHTGEGTGGGYARSRPGHEATEAIGTALGLAAVALLVLATAFFVAAEFAIVATDRNRLEARAAAGSRGARTALAVHRQLSYHLSGAQLGLTVVSLLLGFVAEPTIAEAIQPALDGPLAEGTAHGVSVALALALATVLSMVLGELVPKNVVLAAPDRAAVRLAGPLRVFSVALSPLIKLSNGTANRLLRLVGVEPAEELHSARTLDDLAELVRSSSAEGTLARDRATLLDRSIRFGEKTVADALVPRVQVDALSVDQTFNDLVEVAVRTGHSRFPVVGEDLDDVVGVVHVKDVFRVPFAERGATRVGDLMAEPVAVPETRSLERLFADLRQGGRQLAIVVDEHGGLAGIVTLEDLLEEIVGEIDDEYDPVTTAVRFDDSSGSWVLAGALHHDEVRQACGFDMPEGEYDTLAGFVLDRLGHLPQAGESVEEDGWRFEVVDMDRHRIATVRVTARPKEAAP